ncbi:MAG TPA: HlyD family secretion protein, partial [Kofleriaceae bacterium]|nr:HlyD family secretion protein [Kofleriaceae bacterium]
LLLDPSNQRARRALGVVSGRIDRARARMTGRSARASRDGIVGDVRVRPGMLLAPGDHMMTVVGESATPTVIALLPARHRPELAAGMELRLELTGHSRADIRGVVEEVGGAVIGPREARRLVGADIGDALAIGGPVVVVRARLSQRTFESRGGSYAFHDGMLGTGEVQLGSSVLLSALIPGGDD